VPASYVFDSDLERQTLTLERSPGKHSAVVSQKPQDLYLSELARVVTTEPEKFYEGRQSLAAESVRDRLILSVCWQRRRTNAAWAWRMI
jgi:hypothetical protein